MQILPPALTDVIEALGRLPGGRGQMLRVLSGLQRGWTGRLRLPAAFLDKLGELKSSTAHAGSLAPQEPPTQ